MTETKHLHHRILALIFLRHVYLLSISISYVS